MIYVFHVTDTLIETVSNAENERQLVNLVINNIEHYNLVCRVKHAELDIAFAATGGPTQWVNVDNMAVAFEPSPNRATIFGDILVEAGTGYVNLSTPAGFIPLVDIVEMNGELSKKTLN